MILEKKWVRPRKLAVQLTVQSWREAYACMSANGAVPTTTLPRPHGFDPYVEDSDEPEEPEWDVSNATPHMVVPVLSAPCFDVFQYPMGMPVSLRLVGYANLPVPRRSKGRKHRTRWYVSGHKNYDQIVNPPATPEFLGNNRRGRLENHYDPSRTRPLKPVLTHGNMFRGSAYPEIDKDADITVVGKCPRLMGVLGFTTHHNKFHTEQLKYSEGDFYYHEPNNKKGE